MKVMNTHDLGLNGPNRRRRDKYVSRAWYDLAPAPKTLSGVPYDFFSIN